MLHIVSTFDGTMDTLDVMPKDKSYQVLSNLYPRRILDV